MLFQSRTYDRKTMLWLYFLSRVLNCFITVAYTAATVSLIFIRKQKIWIFRNDNELMSWTEPYLWKASEVQRLRTLLTVCNKHICRTSIEILSMQVRPFRLRLEFVMSSYYLKTATWGLVLCDYIVFTISRHLDAVYVKCIVFMLVWKLGDRSD